MELKKIFKGPYYIYRIIRDYTFCKIKIGYWDMSWRFHGLPLIEKAKGSTIKIGKKFVACSNAKFNTIGVPHKVIIKTISRNAIIEIGDHVGMSGAVMSSASKISIGDNVLIGSGVLIMDSDAHPIHPKDRRNSNLIKTKPVVIEENVFIGARSIIMKGVTIGRGSVVGAGSVVTQNVEAMTIVAGNPAKFLKNII